MHDEISKLKQEAEKFQESGGSIALFWAGRMIVAARQVLKSNVLDLSINLKWLKMVANCYDEVILKEANKKD